MKSEESPKQIYAVVNTGEGKVMTDYEREYAKMVARAKKVKPPAKASSTPLTEDLIDDLAKEAEEGYDLKKGSSPLKLAQEAKRAKAEERSSEIDAQVEQLLSNPSVNEELQRKLRYCQRELQRGNRDLGDTNMLIQRRRDLLREADRVR